MRITNYQQKLLQARKNKTKNQNNLYATVLPHDPMYVLSPGKKRISVKIINYVVLNDKIKSYFFNRHASLLFLRTILSGPRADIWFSSCHHGVERRRPLSWAVVVVCPRPSTSQWPWHLGNYQLYYLCRNSWAIQKRGFVAATGVRLFSYPFLRDFGHGSSWLVTRRFDGVAVTRSFCRRVFCSIQMWLLVDLLSY